MQTIIMQPWLTIRGQTTISTITQETSQWIDVGPYQDVVFWSDCREVNAAGGTAVNLIFQTAPARDENLFRQLGATVPLAASTTPVATPVLLFSNPAVPLSSFIRWQLVLVGTATSAWDATFRIYASLNR